MIFRNQIEFTLLLMKVREEFGCVGNLDGCRCGCSCLCQRHWKINFGFSAADAVACAVEWKRKMWCERAGHLEWRMKFIKLVLFSLVQKFNI